MSECSSAATFERRAYTSDFGVGWRGLGADPRLLVKVRRDENPRLERDLHVAVQRNDGRLLEEAREAIDVDALALEDVVRRRGVAVEQEQTVRHDAKHAVLFGRKDVDVALGPQGALVGDQRNDLVEADDLVQVDLDARRDAVLGREEHAEQLVLHGRWVAWDHLHGSLQCSTRRNRRRV